MKETIPCWLYYIPLKEQNQKSTDRSRSKSKMDKNTIKHLKEAKIAFGTYLSDSSSYKSTLSISVIRDLEQMFTSNKESQIVLNDFSDKKKCMLKLAMLVQSFFENPYLNQLNNLQLVANRKDEKISLVTLKKVKVTFDLMREEEKELFIKPVNKSEYLDLANLILGYKSLNSIQNRGKSEIDHILIDSTKISKDEAIQKILKKYEIKIQGHSGYNHKNIIELVQALYWVGLHPGVCNTVLYKELKRSGENLPVLSDPNYFTFCNNHQLLNDYKEGISRSKEISKNWLEINRLSFFDFSKISEKDIEKYKKTGVIVSKTTQEFNFEKTNEAVEKSLNSIISIDLGKKEEVKPQVNQNSSDPKISDISRKNNLVQNGVKINQIQMLKRLFTEKIISDNARQQGKIIPGFVNYKNKRDQKILTKQSNNPSIIKPMPLRLSASQLQQKLLNVDQIDKLQKDASKIILNQKPITRSNSQRSLLPQQIFFPNKKQKISIEKNPVKIYASNLRLKR
ncbi:hypothetical protein N9Y17_02260 [Gammaproteobacteria bacterium]|nr:hypothetical protein [Gammaproteobacteria bacterium]